jgi:hypothetical protein
MKRMRLCWAVVGLWLMAGGAGVAQMTTTVTDTLYHADGSTAQGTLLISWPQFTTASGAAVAAGSTTVTLSSGGGLSVALAPNAGSNPIGSYYTVVYHLDDGTLTRENWMVPVSSTAVHLTAVRSTVMPTSVAMQTVTKAYVDSAIASTLATNSIPPAVSLQAVLAGIPFNISGAGCEDASGDGTEGLLFQNGLTSGTPTCNGLLTTDGDGNLYFYSSGGVQNASITNNGAAVFKGISNGGQKISGLGNGTAASDAAAFGQLPAGATATVAGVVKLASGQTSTTLSTVATTGSASDIGSGTLSDGRLSSNVALLNASNTFSGATNSYNSNISVGGGNAITLGGGDTVLYGDGHIVTTYFGFSGGHFLTGVQGTTGANMAACNGSFTSGHLWSTDANQNCADSGVAVDGSGNITTSGRIAAQRSTPGSSSAACSAGQIWTDSNYIYVCTATNTIERAALSSF